MTFGACADSSVAVVFGIAANALGLVHVHEGHVLNPGEFFTPHDDSSSHVVIFSAEFLKLSGVASYD